MEGSSIIHSVCFPLMMEGKGIVFMYPVVVQDGNFKNISLNRSVWGTSVPIILWITIANNFIQLLREYLIHELLPLYMIIAFTYSLIHGSMHAKQCSLLKIHMKFLINTNYCDWLEDLIGATTQG